MPDAYKKSACIYCGKLIGKHEPKICSTDEAGEIIVCCEKCSTEKKIKFFVGGAFNGGERKGRPAGSNQKS